MIFAPIFYALNDDLKLVQYSWFLKHMNNAFLKYFFLIIFTMW